MSLMKSSVSGDDGRMVVAIVGGGFSGTTTAVQLARQAGERRLRVVLMERAASFGKGVAYSTRCDRHLLNVPAGLMSALADQPSHFLDWLRDRDPQFDAGSFVPRRLYGEYLEQLLRSTASEASIPIECLRDEAIDLAFDAGGTGASTLRLASGRKIRADVVILAIGNHPPLNPPRTGGLESSARYAPNPWSPGLLEGVGADEPIALIGSGLTAVDVIVEADSLGHRGVIHAISRHGWLPNAHRPAVPRPHFELGHRTETARGLLRSVRVEAAVCQAEGGDWRSVVDGIRPVAQTLWRSLPGGERQRFVRHLASHWDAHRHRVAPQIDAMVQDRLRDGGLSVIAGRVVDAEDRGDRLVLQVRRRGHARVESITAGLVVNCTGPARDIRESSSRLLQALFHTGVVRPGLLALGLDADDRGALFRSDGQVHERLFAIGPLLKDQLWETTAVRELRVQAAELANRVLSAV